MKTLKFIFAVILVTLFVFNSVLAQGKYYVDENNVVIKGYDVVGYFTINEAVKGSKNHSVEYDGVTWYFANEEHKKMFIENTEKYLPSYGGYCAFGMGAKNSKVPTNAETFKLYNGELLLFFDDMYEGKHLNTSVMWNQDEQNFKKKADQNWDKMN